MTLPGTPGIGRSWPANPRSRGRAPRPHPKRAQTSRVVGCRKGPLRCHRSRGLGPKVPRDCPHPENPDPPEVPSMWHPQRKPHTAGVLAGLIAAGGIFALQGEARATYCQEYETTVMIPPNRPVKAIGRVCQVNGKWYLTTSSRGRWGGDGFSRQPGVRFSGNRLAGTRLAEYAACTLRGWVGGMRCEDLKQWHSRPMRFVPQRILRAEAFWLLIGIEEPNLAHRPCALGRQCPEPNSTDAAPLGRYS
jgi:hypothetical protein